MLACNVREVEETEAHQACIQGMHVQGIVPKCLMLQCKRVQWKKCRYAGLLITQVQAPASRGGVGIQ